MSCQIKLIKAKKHRRKTDELQKANAALEPAVKELKKVRKLLIVKIQLVDNESDETDDDNLRTLDTLSLLKKYEKVSFRHYSKNSKSSERDEILEKLESQVAKLKAKNEKLKTRASQSDNGFLDLKEIARITRCLENTGNLK